MQIHRELSSKEGPLIDKMTGGNGWKALTDRQVGDIQAIKDVLRTAASDGPNPLMPSFRPAVQEFAKGSEPIEAFESTKDAANRVAQGSIVKGRKLATQSSEALSKKIGEMSPEQASAGQTGALTAAKEQTRLTANPFSGFGVLPSASRVAKIAPIVNQLSQQANQGGFYHGLSLPELLQALGISQASGNK